MRGELPGILRRRRWCGQLPAHLAPGQRVTCADITLDVLQVVTFSDISLTAHRAYAGVAVMAMPSAALIFFHAPGTKSTERLAGTRGLPRLDGTKELLEPPTF